MKVLGSATFTKNIEDPIRKIKILLADDHPLLRKSLRTSLEREPDFDVIAEAKDGEEAINLAKKLAPDVVIMDISMPRINGLEATKQIVADCPSTLILALTIHNDNEHIFSILQSGASGYLTKNADEIEVANAIRSLVSGDTVLSRDILKKFLRYTGQYTEKPDKNKYSSLSMRELELLRLIARGMSNKEISESLDLSLRTVKSYLTNIFVKLNVTSRTAAMVTCIRNGILIKDDFE